MNNRKCNIELLRIIAMLMIIVHHYAIHGGILKEGLNGVNGYIAVYIYSFGKLAVNVFIMTSGYFLIDCEYKIKKIIKLVLHVIFYSLIIMLFYIIYYRNCEIEFFNKMFFPFRNSMYWYATTYLMLYLLSPYINVCVKNISKKDLQKLIIIMFFMMWYFRLVCASSLFNLFWFIYIYIIGAYIKMYGMHQLLKKYNKQFLIVYCIIMFLILSWINYNFIGYIDIVTKVNKICEMNSFIMLVGTVLLFFMFEQLTIEDNKCIKWLGKVSFGVYLFHDHPMIRKILWQDFLKCSFFYDKSWCILIIHLTICTVIIYSIGVIIELFRINFIENIVFKSNLKLKVGRYNKN